LTKYNKFTLIELMIVIAIIGILMSMLLPALGKARMATKRAVCANNLKQMFIAETNYTLSNNDRITPGNIDFISFDDLLADYMGREMTEDQKGQNDLKYSIDADAAINNQSLMCPNDTFERFHTDKIPRSYVGNGKDFTSNVSEGDDRWGPMRGGWAPAIGQVSDSSGTISFTERHGSNNFAGRIVRASLENANHLVSGSSITPAPHGKYLRYNFAYWDGHVIEKKVSSTCDSYGNPSGKDWSMDPND